MVVVSSRFVGWLTLLLAALGAVALLLAFLKIYPAIDVQVRVSGMDGRPATASRGEQPVDLRGSFQQFSGAASALPGYWPRFRGPKVDNIAWDAPPLADSWGNEGPPVLWSIPLGEGYAGPAVHKGRVYVLDYDEEKRADALRCFSLDDGQEIWRHSYKVDVKRNHGMSRTVPAVTDRYVVSIGPRCHVVCLDAETGEFRWGMDLQRDFGTEEPLWYTGQCPLIDENWVILAPAGPDTFIMAVALDSGEITWKVPNPGGWKMSHSSIIPLWVAGKRTYVYVAIGGIVGISAERDDWGTLLWTIPWEARVNAPSPISIEENRILVLAGYGTGGMFLQINKTASGFACVEVSRHNPKEGIAAEQHTPIVYNNHIYVILPKDAGALKEQFACYRPDGSLVWSSGTEHRFGLGPYLLADDKFFIMDDNGVLHLAKVSTEAFILLDKAKVLHAHESWGPMALAHDRLLVRDAVTMACLFVGIPQEPTQ